MKRFSKLGVVAAIFAAVSMLVPSPAHAVGAGVITGSGSIGANGVPGPTGGTVVNNDVRFTGTATGVFVGANADAGSCAISFQGGGTDSTATGSGSGSASCNGTGVLGNSISLNCSVSYTRVGVAVVITGDCGAGTLMAGAFVFVPLNVNPTTSYMLAGAAATTA